MDDQHRNALMGWGFGLLGALGVAALVRKRRSYRFTGRTVVLTGGSRGLGLVLARVLSREGARLVLLARNADDLARAAAELGPEADVLTVPCDVTERTQVEEAIKRARRRFGRIDVLINNAGLISVGPLENQTLADFEEALATHFWAPLYTTLAVLPEMRQRREGRIVNIASIGGKISLPHMLPYCASKFALVGLSEGLHAELAKDGIEVTTVCPGLMRTGSPRNACFSGQAEAEYAWFAVANSLPGLSIGAEAAARQIVEACRRGAAELVITFPAVFGTVFHGVAPGITAELLGGVNRLLPPRGSSQTLPGKAVETPLTRSWVTALTRRAEAANNQTGGA